MAARRALVVDDSRSARAFLTRILERYELAVDGVESAEQAIEYLTQQRPDVIFMDHLMPGMDGFQAVQTIKNNPLTATIPIMMYTSQEGELYLSQARALGAIGVLPKQTQHTDVAKALEQLHLLGEPRLESEIVARPTEAAEQPPAVALEDTADIAIPAAEAAAPAADGQRALPRAASIAERRGTARPDLPALSPELRAIIESMVLHHIRELQRFVADHLESQADRVVADVRLMLKDQPSPVSALVPPPEPLARGGFWIGALGLTVAALALWLWQQQRVDMATLSGQLLQAQQQLEATHTQLQSAEAADQSAVNAASLPGAAAGGPDADFTIEPVPYGEMPLAGSRLDRIQMLLARLNVQGFQGEILIRTIPGRFCMVTGSGQSPVLPPDNWPFSRCEQIGNPREDNGSASLRQSVAFANMIATARQNGNGKLDIQIVAGTPDETVTPYPPVSDGLTAGEWNRVALANNRVEVHWQAKR
jgi:CheY-like chemotaxis protein